MVLRNQMRIATVWLLGIATGPCVLAQIPLVGQNAVVAEKVFAQSGLRLPTGRQSLSAVVAAMAEQQSCEIIRVKWTSLPGHGMMRSVDAAKVHLPQTLSLVSRSSFTDCQPKFYRGWEFETAVIFAFGTTDSDEIRGVYVDHDPRSFIAECPELWGEKSKPETKCGEFIKPEVAFDVRMPQEGAITKVVLFGRSFSGPAGQWQLERLATLDLRQNK